MNYIMCELFNTIITVYKLKCKIFLNVDVRVFIFITAVEFLAICYNIRQKRRRVKQKHFKKYPYVFCIHDAYRKWKVFTTYKNLNFIFLFFVNK
jgi:hypothetical protein